MITILVVIVFAVISRLARGSFPGFDFSFLPLPLRVLSLAWIAPVLLAVELAPPNQDWYMRELAMSPGLVVFFAVHVWQRRYANSVRSASRPPN